MKTECTSEACVGASLRGAVVVHGQAGAWASLFNEPLVERTKAGLLFNNYWINHDRKGVQLGEDFLYVTFFTFHALVSITRERKHLNWLQALTSRKLVGPASDSMAVGGTRKRRKRHDRVLEPDIRTAVWLSLGTARHEADSGRSVLARTPLSS